VATCKPLSTQWIFGASSPDVFSAKASCWVINARIHSTSKFRWFPRFALATCTRVRPAKASRRYAQLGPQVIERIGRRPTYYSLDHSQAKTTSTSARVWYVPSLECKFELDEKSPVFFHVLPIVKGN
jgi:hypothetical protein